MLSHIPGLYLLYVNHSQLWQSTMSPDIARCCLGNKLNCSSELMLINVQTHRPASFPKLHFSFFFFRLLPYFSFIKRKKSKYPWPHKATNHTNKDMHFSVKTVIELFLHFRLKCNLGLKWPNIYCCPCRVYHRKPQVDRAIHLFLATINKTALCNLLSLLLLSSIKLISWFSVASVLSRLRSTDWSEADSEKATC